MSIRKYIDNTSLKKSDFESDRIEFGFRPIRIRFENFLYVSFQVGSEGIRVNETNRIFDESWFVPVRGQP